MTTSINNFHGIAYLDEEVIKCYIAQKTFWATRHFMLNGLEESVFRGCLEFYYLGKESVYYSGRTGFREFFTEQECKYVDCDLGIILLALSGIYSMRVKDYHENVMPPSDLFADGDEVKDDNLLVGQWFSEFNKSVKPFISLLKNASELTIRIKDGQIVSSHVKTKLDSKNANNGVLSMLNDFREDGFDVLAKLDKSGFIEDRDEITRLYHKFNDSLLGDDDDNSRLTFGTYNNGMKRVLIHSLYPLFTYLYIDVKKEYSPLFEEYTKRDMYKFIMKFTDIDEQYITIDQIEDYLKSPDKIKPFLGFFFNNDETKKRLKEFNTDSSELPF